MRSELALDLALPCADEAGKVTKEASSSSGGHGTAKLEEYIRRLEEERRKIEGFRRELPLCMSILNEKIERLKEEVMECGGRGGGGSRLEEFIAPVRTRIEEPEGAVRHEKDFRDKVSWMSSAQLWSDNHSANTSSTTSTTVAATDASSSNSRKHARERAVEDLGGGGSFLPFKEMTGYPPLGGPKKEKTEEAAAPPLPNLSLLSPAAKVHRVASASCEDPRSVSSISRVVASRGMAPSADNEQPVLSMQQASRKPRRCWSPELHRRFVKALHQLGGAHAATPKQIRELMKVDGLTNDEVKSHLQKYRLHTRRAPSSSSPEKHPMLMMGGIWPPSENFSGSKQNSGSPQGPLHLTNAGEDSGEEEDERSESYSWKGQLQRINGEETD